MNIVILSERLGQDCETFTTANGSGARLSVATSKSYKEKASGEWKELTEWHRIVTFQPGLVKMLEKHAVKGRKIEVRGELRTRKFNDAAGVEKYAADIVVDRDGHITFTEPLKTGGGEAYPDDDLPL